MSIIHTDRIHRSPQQSFTPGICKPDAPDPAAVDLYIFSSHPADYEKERDGAGNFLNGNPAFFRVYFYQNRPQLVQGEIENGLGGKKVALDLFDPVDQDRKRVVMSIFEDGSYRRNVYRIVPNKVHITCSGSAPAVRYELLQETELSADGRSFFRWTYSR